MCASAGLGENGVSCVRDGCNRWMDKGPHAVPYLWGQRLCVQQRRASKRVRSEFNCQINGRQLRHLDGNACTEYEDESPV
jgi:hypothetical protein